VFNVEVNRQFTNTTENLDFSTNHFAGYFLYSNESVQPNWKGRMSIDWTICCMQFHYDVQYIGHLHDYDGGGDIYGNYIPAYWYHNISVAMNLEDIVNQPDLVKGMQVIVGINNLADKDPPFLNGDSICKCNSLAGPYDFVGRFFYTRLSIKN
jgi:outer membrane receptor protein involved in Fe transport